MKFKILRSSFFRTLSHLQGIVDKKNSLPILSNILIEAKENKLTLSDLPQTIHDLFKEMSTSYVPTMIANKKAIEESSDEWEIDLDKGKWKQKSFPYQAKCLAWIKEEYEKLDTDKKDEVFSFLQLNHCESLVTSNE